MGRRAPPRRRVRPSMERSVREDPETHPDGAHGPRDEASARALLVRSLRIDTPRGRLEWNGDRYVLLRPGLLVNLQKQLEQTVGASTKGILYLAGEKSGRDGTQQSGDLLRRLGTARVSDAEASAGTSDASGLMGWGRYAVTSLDLASGRAVVTLDGSPIAELYGPSKKPVCHLLAGWIAGIAAHVFAREFLCEEVTCGAQGKERCEFHLRPMPSA